MCNAGLGERLEFHDQAVPQLGTCRANVGLGWEVLSSLERPREAPISLLFLKLRTPPLANDVSSVRNMGRKRMSFIRSSVRNKSMIST